jgi:hypothetical protein
VTCDIGVPVARDRGGSTELLTSSKLPGLPRDPAQSVIMQRYGRPKLETIDENDIINQPLEDRKSR